MMQSLKVLILLCFGLNHFVSMASKNQKYFIPSVRANWFKANEFCNSLQMRLAIVKSKEDNEAIAAYVKTTDKYTNACSFWLGATDLAHEGHYIWTATGEQVTYTNWRYGEPNNKNQREHCLQLGYEPRVDYIWSWNDQNCNEKWLYFVCEKVECNCVAHF